MFSFCTDRRLQDHDGNFVTTDQNPSHDHFFPTFDRDEFADLFQDIQLLPIIHGTMSAALETPGLPADITTQTTTTTTTPYTGKQKKTLRKDKHSKIVTASGPRDRRMRLSLDVAKKFFDLQDALGFDKASKTVEWLLSKSTDSIKSLTTWGGSGSKNRRSGAGTAKIKSCISECEVVSTNHLGKDDKEEYNVILAPASCEIRGKAKTKRTATTRAHRNVASDPKLVKESRKKARARARERTMEKKMLNSGTAWFDDANNYPPKQVGISASDYSCEKSADAMECGEKSFPMKMMMVTTGSDEQGGFSTSDYSCNNYSGNVINNADPFNFYHKYWNLQSSESEITEEQQGNLVVNTNFNQRGWEGFTHQSTLL